MFLFYVYVIIYLGDNMNIKDVLEKGKLVFPDDRNIIFKSKQDVCDLFGIKTVKHGYQELSFYKLNEEERIWLVKESTKFENGYIDDFYRDYIKEIRENNPKGFVLDILKSPNERRYVFLKTGSGYEFFGTYMLDAERTKESLEIELPTRYWNKISNEVVFK